MTSSVPKHTPILVQYPRPSEPSSSKTYYGSSLLNETYDYFQIGIQCYLFSLNSTSYVLGSIVGTLIPLAAKYHFNVIPVNLDSDENKKALSKALIMDHDAKEPDPKKSEEDIPYSYFSVYLIHCGIVIGTNTLLSSFSPTLGNIMTMVLAGKYSNDLSQRAIRWLSAPPAKKKPFVLNVPH